MKKKHINSKRFHDVVKNISENAIAVSCKKNNTEKNAIENQETHWSEK